MLDSDKPKDTALASVDPPPSKRATRKLDLAVIIAICNLLLTACTGIVLTLYLNYRNEQFQKQLIELQNKAELANLEIKYEEERILVRNLGPGTAQNLSLVFCISFIDSEWESSIKHISDFDLSLHNIARESSETIQESICPSATYSDAVQLSIQSLPPQQTLYVDVAPSTNLTVTDVEIETNVYMIESLQETQPFNDGSDVRSPSSMEEFTDSPFNRALDKYLAQYEFKIADMEVNVACGNCNLSQEKITITISSFKGQEPGQIAFDNSTSDQKIYIRTDTHYSLPEGVDPGPKEDLYLAAIVENGSKVTMERIEKFEFIDRLTP
jgi:hypothetical protein